MFKDLSDISLGNNLLLPASSLDLVQRLIMNTSFIYGVGLVVILFVLVEMIELMKNIQKGKWYEVIFE
eukprot:gene335-6749_t